MQSDKQLVELFTEAIRGEIPMEVFYDRLSRASMEEVVEARNAWVEQGVASTWLHEMDVYKDATKHLQRAGREVIDRPYDYHLHVRCDLLGNQTIYMSRNEIVRHIFNTSAYPENVAAAGVMIRLGKIQELKSLVDGFSPRDYNLLVLERAVYCRHSVEKSRAVLAVLLMQVM